jgi:hypothetical protein
LYIEKTPISKKHNKQEIREMIKVNGGIFL